MNNHYRYHDNDIFIAIIVLLFLSHSAIVGAYFIDAFV